MDLPQGPACDSHVHVFWPSRFPYGPARSYTPPAADLVALESHLASQSLSRVVLVQPSCYGDDNRALVQALHDLGPQKVRGVAVLDLEGVSDAALQALHEAGVRGVRFNLHVQAQSDLAAVERQLHQAASRLALWGWHVQLHAGAPLVIALASVLQRLAVPVVLDHFAGGAEAAAAVAALLEAGNTWVKLSAPYRVPADGLANTVRQWARLRPDRLVWGSDWPHTGGGGVRTANPAAVEPFRVVDLAASRAWLQRALADDAGLQRLMVTNPQTLYGFDDLAPASAPQQASQVS